MSKNKIRIGNGKFIEIIGAMKQFKNINIKPLVYYVVLLKIIWKFTL